MDPLVTTDWLDKHLGDADLRVVDATWYLPAYRRDARAEHDRTHVPGAVFFDVDAVADHTSGLPHMLPSPAAFARAVGGLGIGDGDRVVVYGARGMIASARVWWMLRVFGHEAVAVLDGGLTKWRTEVRTVESGAVMPVPRTFTPRFRPELVYDLDRMRANVTRRADQVVDARSAGRFAATEPEPRAGLRGGHIPGSLNLPYDRLYAPDGTLLPPPALRHAFGAAGVDLGDPIVTSCGSGVSACSLTFALHVLGRVDVPVYDGSWSEWGSRGDTPIQV